MYVTIGAVTENGILVFNNNNNVLEECIKHIVLIRQIKGEPIYKNSRGDGFFYKPEDIEGDVMPLYEKETFAVLLDCGLISHAYRREDPNTRNWLLGHLIQFEDIDLPTDLLEYVYNDNPSYDLSGWLSLTNRLEIAKWLYSTKGVSLEACSGYPSAMESWGWDKEKNKELIDYFSKIESDQEPVKQENRPTKITDWLNSQKDYGMCNPPMDAQTALYFLADYLDIPVNVLSESVQQTNTYYVCEILNRYSKKYRKEVKAQAKITN